MSTEQTDSEQPSGEMLRVCSILERIARGFAQNSEENLALRDAALAYTVVFQHEQLTKAYLKLRAAFNGTLTEEMKGDLRRHGIDPDELEIGIAADSSGVLDDEHPLK